MPKGYKHLSFEERVQIATLKKQGVKQKEIAKQLKRSESCISTELKRNKTQKGYNFNTAQKKASTRKSLASKGKNLKMTSLVIKMINQKICLDWSPVQISGFLKKKNQIYISHERIYQHVWEDKTQGGTLYKHLRHKGKKYNKRSEKKAGRGLIPGRVDISERPKIVEEKARVGDFEIDTIIGAHHKGAIVSLVDRFSKYTKLVLVERNTAELVTQAIQSAMKKIKKKVKTLTADNGKEFAYHAKFGDALGADVYFATPYHSWERGLNEHTNGLVRQYFPKKTNFATLTQAEVLKVEKKLNTRPRKILNFNTPEEVFFKPNLMCQKILLAG
jgi:IS30 family transposase